MRSRNDVVDTIINKIEHLFNRISDIQKQIDFIKSTMNENNCDHENDETYCYVCKVLKKRISDIRMREDITVVFEDGKYYSLKNYIEKVMNKKREMKKFHCTHCGKSTIVEI